MKTEYLIKLVLSRNGWCRFCSGGAAERVGFKWAE